MLSFPIAVNSNSPCPMMMLKILLKSCATPPANRPIASSCCAFRKLLFQMLPLGHVALNAPGPHQTAFVHNPHHCVAEDLDSARARLASCDSWSSIRYPDWINSVMNAMVTGSYATKNSDSFFPNQRAGIKKAVHARHRIVALRNVASL